VIIDELMPDPEFGVSVHVIVDADPATTFAAIDTANLMADPTVRWLGSARDLPNRALARMRGQAYAPAPKRFTFADTGAGPEWVDLGENPGVEKVSGAVGQFWKRDYGWQTLTPGELRAFNAPGFAKTLVSFSVHPYGRRTLLVMDSRTAATDEGARCRFTAYWRFIRPFAALMMWRGLCCVKAEAEALASGRLDGRLPAPASSVDVARSA
jgi:hypothetical protein